MNRHQRRHLPSGFARTIQQTPPNTQVNVVYGWDVTRNVVLVKYSMPVMAVDLTPTQAEAMITQLQKVMGYLGQGLLELPPQEGKVPDGSS